MYKKYDHQKPKSYRSYKISDICRLYRDKKLHEQTVRKWVKSGQLEAIFDGNVILIYGAVLKRFLQDSNQQHQKKLEFSHFRCGKCKTKDAPLEHQVTLQQGRGGSIQAFGMCITCGHCMHRHYKASQRAEIEKVFHVLHSEVRRLDDSSDTTSKTHIENNPKTPPSESPKKYVQQSNIASNSTHIKPPQKTPSSSKTHSPFEQLSLF
jgi:DNA-directed RNA polymerase subunit M/transcription elongation factor TFIIS